MMSNMPTIFNFKDREVRVVMVNNEPWFVAKDVAAALDMARSTLSEAVNGKKRKREDGSEYISGGLDDDEKGFVSVETLGGVQQMLAVSESGLYALIHYSDKLEAKAFQRWVRKTVIPSIRKTGQYTASQNVVPLSKEQALVTVLRTTADLMEGQEELRQGQQQLEIKLAEVDRKVEEQITLNSHEQRKAQKEIAKRVYELAEQVAFKQLGFDGTEEIVPDLEKERRKLFSEIHRAIKDCFAVPSYRDVRRSEFNQLLLFIQAWRPRLVA
jgi:prophage antirepressor-like protein